MIKRILTALAVGATTMVALVVLPATPASAVNDVQRSLTCSYAHSGVTRINGGDFIVATYTSHDVWLRVLLSDPMPNREWRIQFKKHNPTVVLDAATTWGSFDWITEGPQNPSGADTYQVVATNASRTVTCSATITGTF